MKQYREMSFAKVFSAQNFLLEAKRVDIEVDLSNSLHSFSIVGLTDKAIDEARDRVSSAIKNSGFKPPKQRNQKVVVSLAPADLRKNGTNFDVPIALAYLKATGDIDFDSTDRIFVGELSLDGFLRPIRGILPLILFAKNAGFKEVFIPAENIREAAIISGIKIYGAKHIKEIIDHIKQEKTGRENFRKISSAKPIKLKNENNLTEIDLSEIKGNESAKRALLISISGGHNISFFGPPGTGKTMLAKAASGILPDLSHEKIIESSSIYSIAGIKNNLISSPPFRAPHHTASYVSITGGGNNLKPGEITLAHNGILFMDEFPEFERRTIDALRQPIEEKKICISRAGRNANFPADFILITSMNPCPCGNFGNSEKICKCSSQNIENYKRKISGPIIDRIDMWIEVSRVEHQKLLIPDKIDSKNSSSEIKKIVTKIRQIQMNRAGKLNGNLSSKEVERFCSLLPEDKKILDQAAQKLGLSARGYFRTLKLARTIADLYNSQQIKLPHILEALQYRSKNIYD